MRIQSRSPLCAIALAVTFLLSIFVAQKIKAQDPSDASNNAQIKQLLKQYVDCIDAADLQMADKIWSHSPDDIFLDPRGTHRGLKAIKEEFIGQTMGAMFSRRELLLEDPQIHIYGDTAWSEMTWTFHATVRNGPQITTQGRETQFYRKEDGEWHIVVIHYSGLPETGKMKGF